MGRGEERRRGRGGEEERRRGGEEEKATRAIESEEELVVSVFMLSLQLSFTTGGGEEGGKQTLYLEGVMVYHVGLRATSTQTAR